MVSRKLNFRNFFEQRNIALKKSEKEFPNMLELVWGTLFLQNLQRTLNLKIIYILVYVARFFIRICGEKICIGDKDFITSVSFVNTLKLSRGKFRASKELPILCHKKKKFCPLSHSHRFGYLATHETIPHMPIFRITSGSFWPFGVSAFSYFGIIF